MAIIIACEDPALIEHIRYSFECLLSCKRWKWRVVSYVQLVGECVSIDDVTISYGLNPPERTRHNAIHIYESSFFRSHCLDSRVPPMRPIFAFEEIPILFADPLDTPPVHKTGHGINTWLDIVASTFFVMTRYEEAMMDTRDRHGRFPSKCSLAVANDFWKRPIVDEYSTLLHLWLEMLDVIVPAPVVWKEDSEFILCLTHDIDDLRKFRAIPPLGTIWRTLRLNNGVRRSSQVIKDYLSSRAQGSDPFLDCAYWLTEMESVRGHRSTFFLMGDNSRYSCSNPDAIRLFSHMQQLDFEIALHAGLTSHASAANLSIEKQALEQVLGRQVLGNRNHYLTWNWNTTPANLQKVGFTYDSSSGYPEGVGFRTGTCRPYRLFDLAASRITDVWEIPLMAMDTGLYMMSAGDLANIERVVTKMLEIVRKYHGVATLLWHNTMYETDRSGGRDLYCRLLDSASALGGSAMTMAEVATLAAAYCGDTGAIDCGGIGGRSTPVRLTP